jgi:ABC-type lipopolysaccharide export system ATPase subunit
MITYNLSTILNEAMKQTKQKSNTIQVPNSFLENKKINNHNLSIDIELANRKSLELYRKLNSKPKFIILDLNQDIDINKDKSQNQEIDKKHVNINKKGILIVGCFCVFLASFHYFNFNLKNIKSVFSFRMT